MATLDEQFATLTALAASPARRISPKAAAKYLGVHRRTLEDWRRFWRLAEKEGKPELRRGPKFIKIGKRVFYEVRDLDEFLAKRKTGGAKRDGPPEPSIH